MKMIKVIVIAFLIIFIAYILYLVIGMSSTYPAIKEYSFGVNKASFEQKLSDRINSSKGWSLEKKDSIKGENEVCYWTSLFYEENGQKFEYDIKYCVDLQTLSGNNACVRLEIVGAFDHVKKSGGYKLSDKDVERLLEILDRTILNGLAPACSR